MRYFKHIWWANMWAHRIGGAIIFIITYIWGVQALQEMEFSGYKDNYHSMVGPIVMAFTGAIVLGGVFTRSMMRRLEWKTKLMTYIRYSHKVSSLFINVIYRYSDMVC
jgi:hypothetical protein